MSDSYFTVSFPKKVRKYMGGGTFVETDKTIWVKIGAAFHGKDGSINVQLDALPLNFDGQLYLFPAEKKAKDK